MAKPASRNAISRRGAETKLEDAMATAATTRPATLAACGSACLGSCDHSADKRPQTVNIPKSAAGMPDASVKIGRRLCESINPPPITIATVASAAMPRGTTTSSGKNNRATRQRPASRDEANPGANLFAGAFDRSGVRALPLASERPLSCTR